MDELLGRISAEAGVSQDTARQAVGHILGYIKDEGTDPSVGKMIDGIPGAAGAAAASSGGDDSGGMFGSFGGGGGIMALGGKLMGLGLDMTQIQIVARELVTFAKTHAGEDTVERAIASVPGLAQFSR